MFANLFSGNRDFYLVLSESNQPAEKVELLGWLLGAEAVKAESIPGKFIGPRREMVTPWSSNASDIAGNVGISGVKRIEKFRLLDAGVSEDSYDWMTEAEYDGLSLNSLDIKASPEKVQFVEDISEFNQRMGLALSGEEVAYLEGLEQKLGRKLSDTEVFGFGQINSEHCRHKIFNGQFAIDGKEQQESLFSLIKRTSKPFLSGNPKEDFLVSAYKDNVAFFQGPPLSYFSPSKNSSSYQYGLSKEKSVLSLKAETHNFPTTVEPFSGAATGSGGEIRDRMAGGRGSMPLAGTAVYMTSYSRVSELHPEHLDISLPPREWKYQKPEEILIKASNGASDFGNKFGQPLIVGSVLSFEMALSQQEYAYDRAVMLAGGVGFSFQDEAIKAEPKAGDVVVVLGGENYRIGLGGGAVSSVDGGEVSRELELSAVQRSNPEMQKRAYNAIRTLVESAKNPIVSIHDHGAGGHLNCLSELVEDCGGDFNVDAFPVGDPSLSAREILCNESQERMGLVVSEEDYPLLEEVCQREQVPCFKVGVVNGEKKLSFKSSSEDVFELELEDLFGSLPYTRLEDTTLNISEGEALESPSGNFRQTLEQILSLEGVACKDWLTNKVDRSVTGLVIQQQCVGPYQLPLANLGGMALDYKANSAVVTSIGSQPGVGLVDAGAGGRMSIVEALNNIIWAPLKNGLSSVTLSANWMWPAKKSGENARLYEAVSAVSELACELGVSIPTGKDSLSMTMNYDNGLEVRSPGTVVISAAGESDSPHQIVTPDLKPLANTSLVLVESLDSQIPSLGGSSYAQVVGKLGEQAPDLNEPGHYKSFFEETQSLIREDLVLAGHDISTGGLAVSLLEMAFTGGEGFKVRLDGDSASAETRLFSEQAGLVLQVENKSLDEVLSRYSKAGVRARTLGVVGGDLVEFTCGEDGSETSLLSDYLTSLRDTWFKTSSLLDSKQTEPSLAGERFKNYASQPLKYSLSVSGQVKSLTSEASVFGAELAKIPGANERTAKAAVIREKGTNGDREMAFALYRAGFRVVDVTMPEIMSGEQTLQDIDFIAFPGGFSNSDVLGAAKGWAGRFLFNSQAWRALQSFLERPDTLSIGVCNGCQLMAALGVFDGEIRSSKSKRSVELLENRSGKFESAFVKVGIQPTESVMLSHLVGSELGIWLAHGEGRFSFENKEGLDIPMVFSEADYPGNPNGSDLQAAAIVTPDGRHLAMMPHLERSLFYWQWPYLPYSEKNELSRQASPWLSSFVEARKWIEQKKAQ